MRQILATDSRPSSLRLPPFDIHKGTSTLPEYLAGLAPTYWWKLGEPSGTVATDSGSALTNGTYAGTYTLAQAGIDASVPADTSLLTNGGGMATAGALNLSGASDATMVVLYKPNSVSGTLKSICGIEGSSTFEGNSFQMRHDNADLVGLVGSTGGSGYAGFTITSQLIVSTTYLLALRRTGTSVRMFKNGTAIGTVQTVSGTLAANDKFGIGKRGSDNGRTANGWFQHCAVWSTTALSDATLLQMAQLAGLA